MRTYRITKHVPGGVPFIEMVQADQVLVNQGDAAFFANVEMGAAEYGMATQPRLVLALARGEWSRIEEVQE